MRPPRKLTDKLARIIRERYAAGGCSFQSLARDYGVTGAYISMIVSGAVYRSAGGPLHRPKGRTYGTTGHEGR